MFPVAWCAAGAGFALWRSRKRAYAKALGALVAAVSNGQWISADDFRKTTGLRVKTPVLLKAVEPLVKDGTVHLRQEKGAFYFKSRLMPASVTGGQLIDIDVQAAATDTTPTPTA